MTTKSKKKKHALNPMIILSFIIISLLFVIMTIAMKENIDVNDSLKASVSQCSDLTKVTGKSITGEGTGAGALLAKKAAYTDAQAKFNTWWTTSTSLGGTDGTGKEQTEEALANELDCAKDRPQCQQERNATIACLPTQSADCSYTTSTNTTPISATATCVFGIKCSNACETVKAPSTTPVTYPQCNPSGTKTNNCDPNSIGYFRVENFATATSPEGADITERGSLASAKAYEAAIAGLAAKCSALSTNDPMYQCTDVLLAKDPSIQTNKGCLVPGCKPNGQASYIAPPQLLRKDGSPADTPKMTDCELTAVSQTSTTITMKATCYAACRYEQDCVPMDTPSPILSSPNSSPFR